MAVGKPSRWLFWILLLGLVVFVIAFGAPFLSAYTTGKAVVWFGCSPAALDGQAVCPPGSLATRFTPLTHWIGSVMASVLFVRQFGWLLPGWSVMVLVVGARARRASGSDGIQA